MKKTTRTIAIAAFLLLFVCVFPASAQNADNAYPINAPYQYPITSDSEEWFATDSHADRVGYCQIPEDILHGMSTRALVETVANYPLLVDVLLLSSAELSYQCVLDSFNGVQELEKRPDAWDELVNFISHLDQDDFTCRAALGVIALEGNFPASNDPVQRSLYSDYQDTFSDAYRAYPELAPVASNLTDAQTVQSANKPKTPSGYSLTVSCEYNRDEMSDSDRIQINNSVQSTYGLSPIRQPTRKYNCHSYAWYSVSLPNLWWIGYPDDYINDPLVNRISDVRAGDRIVYRKSQADKYAHSGIISSVPSSGVATGNNIWVTSKWGNWGLYRHTIFNCPLDTYGNLTEYWRIG